MDVPGRCRSGRCPPSRRTMFVSTRSVFLLALTACAGANTQTVTLGAAGPRRPSRRLPRRSASRCAARMSSARPRPPRKRLICRRCSEPRSPSSSSFLDRSRLGSARGSRGGRVGGKSLARLHRTRARQSIARRIRRASCRSCRAKATSPVRRSRAARRPTLAWRGETSRPAAKMLRGLVARALACSRRTCESCCAACATISRPSRGRPPLRRRPRNSSMMSWRCGEGEGENQPARA